MPDYGVAFGAVVGLGRTIPTISLPIAFEDGRHHINTLRYNAKLFASFYLPTILLLLASGVSGPITKNPTPEFPCEVQVKPVILVPEPPPGTHGHRDEQAISVANNDAAGVEMRVMVNDKKNDAGLSTAKDPDTDRYRAELFVLVLLLVILFYLVGYCYRMWQNEVKENESKPYTSSDPVKPYKDSASPLAPTEGKDVGESAGSTHTPGNRSTEARAFRARQDRYVRPSAVDGWKEFIVEHCGKQDFEESLKQFVIRQNLTSFHALSVVQSQNVDDITTGVGNAGVSLIERAAESAAKRINNDSKADEVRNNCEVIQSGSKPVEVPNESEPVDPNKRRSGDYSPSNTSIRCRDSFESIQTTNKGKGTSKGQSQGDRKVKNKADKSTDNGQRAEKPMSTAELVETCQLCHHISKLSLFQMVLLIDDSGSMLWSLRQGHENPKRKEYLKATIQRIVEVATCLSNSRGPAVRFFNYPQDKEYRHKKAKFSETDGSMDELNVNNLARLLKNNKFRGSSFLSEVLREKVLEPFVFEKVRNRSLDKPILISIITDGAPEVRNGPEEAGKNSTGQATKNLIDAISDCKKMLTSAGYPESAVAFHIVQIGDDPQADEFLATLTNEIGTSMFVSWERLGVDVVNPPTSTEFDVERELWWAETLATAIDPLPATSPEVPGSSTET
ncbi:hypothetical protein BDZ91DRAFT_852904 [Kalaharituber pfeilii]|nr:hypothetical protein BDZ91DRAFT_852904 [Kalaharituber pfeilii]